MKIIVSSKNPVKVNSTLEGFQKVFPDTIFEIEGVSVPSGVSDQPMSEDEIILGAENRVMNAFNEFPDADYWVGMEGGNQRVGDEMMAYSWVVIKSKELTGKGRSASFFLAPKLVELINEGKELGEADDIVFGISNVKQQSGTIGLLTDDLITRTTLCVPAVIIALIPFKNMDLYKSISSDSQSNA